MYYNNTPSGHLGYVTSHLGLHLIQLDYAQLATYLATSFILSWEPQLRCLVFLKLSVLPPQVQL